MYLCGQTGTPPLLKYFLEHESVLASFHSCELTTGTEM